LGRPSPLPRLPCNLNRRCLLQNHVSPRISSLAWVTILSGTVTSRHPLRIFAKSLFREWTIPNSSKQVGIWQPKLR
jgi:hypothetical protein